MARSCTVAVNGQSFKTKAGDVLLDAALSNGVHIPHDCRSGLCGSCLTKVVKGTTILGRTSTPRMVYACKARILTDLQVETEDAPEASRVNGFVRSIRPLAEGVVEVTIEPERRLSPLPGQYFKFKFSGFPARSYSATRPLEGRPHASCITLQVRRFPNGRVSSELGRRISEGHPAVIEGPYGSAFFREGKTGRLVLISGGTGFAPIWSIACAALRENMEREILLITGVRSDDSIYMAAGLERLARFPNVDVIVTIGRRPGASEQVREGYPNEHVPSLKADDIVYACGPAQMIEALSPLVARSGAQLYTDPFEPAPENEESLLFESARRLKQMLVPESGWGSPLQNALGKRVAAAR